MSRILVTGSADGLGQMAAKLLVKSGHKVVLHARNKARAAEAHKSVPAAEATVTGDLSSIEETKSIAGQVNKLGPFDAIIHNAGVGYQTPGRIVTVDKLLREFAVNTLAPYILTCLVNKPERLIYLSSSLHQGGDPSLKDLNWEDRPWAGIDAYSDTKLHDVLLAFAVARRWPDVFSNALEPGWVATKMGGPGAPDDLVQGVVGRAMTRRPRSAANIFITRNFYHKKLRKPHASARKVDIQDQLIAECARISGVPFPD